MKIYKNEILDGLEKVIASKLTASCVFSLKSKKRNKVLASINLDQPDLFYIDESILVSSTWNFNDDVFTKEEIWESRNTPVDKQLNYMHDDAFIIGHITASKVLDFSGNVVADDSKIEDVPDDIEIAIASVIYRRLSNAERQEVVDKLLEEIPEDKWAVSMEAIFTDFDYAVVAPDGTQKVVSRNDESSFLTKYLRCYGGTGVYDGYKVGRLLKNLVFSGVGIVDNPANERSTINAFSFNGVKASINDFSEVVMASELKESVDTVSKAQYDELKKELAETKKVADESVAKEVAALKAENAKLTEDLANANKLSDEKTSKIEVLEKSVSEVRIECDNAKAELTKINENLKTQARINKLIEVGVESTKASVIVEKFATASDEMFAEVVELNKAAKKEMMDDSEDEEEVTEKSKCEKLDLDKVAAEKGVLPQGASDKDKDAVAKASVWATEIFKKKK